MEGFLEVRMDMWWAIYLQRHRFVCLFIFKYRSVYNSNRITILVSWIFLTHHLKLVINTRCKLSGRRSHWTDPERRCHHHRHWEEEHRCRPDRSRIERTQKEVDSASLQSYQGSPLQGTWTYWEWNASFKAVSNSTSSHLSSLAFPFFFPSTLKMYNRLQMDVWLTNRRKATSALWFGKFFLAAPKDVSLRFLNKWRSSVMVRSVACSVYSIFIFVLYSREHRSNHFV